VRPIGLAQPRLESPIASEGFELGFHRGTPASVPVVTVRMRS
jgi:hypothetical protein